MAEAGGKPDNIVPSVLLALVLGLLVWSLAGGQVKSIGWVVLGAQLKVVEPVVGLYPTSYQRSYLQLRRILSKPVPRDLTLRQFWKIVNASGAFVAPVALVLMLCLAAWLLKRSPSWRYRRSLNFEQLLTAQARQFPRMRPVLFLKGRQTRESRGNFWWPLSPFEWALAVKCLTASRSPEKVRESFSPERARAALSAQLGRPATAPRYFHEDLLLAVFALRILDRKKDAALLMDEAAAGFGPAWSPLKRFWKSITGSHLDWPANGPWQIVLSPKAEKLLQSTLKELAQGSTEALEAQRIASDTPLSRPGEVMRIYHRSAHLRCALARLLGAAQNTGIISTSDFIWCKAIDRTLHYGCNDVGRRVACAEASGIRAQMQAEDAAGHALESPQVDAALQALQQALEESGWSAPPAMDYDAHLRAMAESQSALNQRIEDSRPAMPIPPTELAPPA